MKIYKLLIVAVWMGFTSCADMDLSPNDRPSSETYFQSETEIQHARIGLYQSNASYNLFNGRVTVWDGMTDQLYDQYSWEGENNVFRGTQNASTGGIITGFYNNAYKVIATANDLIKYAEATDGSLFINRTKAQYIADAQFFKAYYYFYLTELYGGVPLYKEALADIESSKVKQSSKAEILEYILAELDQAIAVLEDGAYKGYANKGAAKTLKGKILLHNERWAEAAAVLNEVISSKHYQLAPNYDEMFWKKGQPNTEIILASEYQYPTFAHSMGRDMVHSAMSVPRQEFVDSYLMADGKPVSESSLDGSDYKNRDPRFYMTVRLPDDVWYDDGGAPVAWEPSLTGGYYTKKFLDPELNDMNALHISGTSEQGIIHLRYADVLLMYAEAVFRSGELTQDIVDQTINPIRERAGMARVTNVAGMTNEQKFALIKYERSIELAFEKHHFFDLRRWNEYGATVVALKDPIGLQAVWNEHFKLWPFGESELILNPNLEQNPGY
ncbi:MAG: RagB/SusD family nutrient uptake outer membrane protein [Tannerella sp.]|nr:RagB/SusD family nutrient uptake outer membrane protein [Tannerella sp.]